MRGKQESGVLLFEPAIRLHVSEGIPDIKKLKLNRQKLLNLFFANSAGLESDDQDKGKHLRLTQSKALFLSTRKPRYVLNFRDVEHFYQLVAGIPDRKP